MNSQQFSFHLCYPCPDPFFLPNNRLWHSIIKRNLVDGKNVLDRGRKMVVSLEKRFSLEFQKVTTALFDFLDASFNLKIFLWKVGWLVGCGWLVRLVVVCV